MGKDLSQPTRLAGQGPAAPYAIKIVSPRYHSELWATIRICSEHHRTDHTRDGLISAGAVAYEILQPHGTQSTSSTHCPSPLSRRCSDAREPHHTGVSLAAGRSLLKSSFSLIQRLYSELALMFANVIQFRLGPQVNDRTTRAQIRRLFQLIDPLCFHPYQHT